MSVNSNKPYDSNLLNVLSFTMDKVQELANANSVLGEKIEVEGMTVIPVSKVSAGFAGGGADINDAGKKKSNFPAGGGGNVTVTPMSFLVIDGKDVSLVNVAPEDKPSPLEDIVKTVVKKIKENKKKK